MKVPHTYHTWLIAAGMAFTAGNGLCADPARIPPASRVFARLQQAVAGAGKNAEPSLALVKMDSDGAAQPQMLKGMPVKPAAPPPMHGIVLTAEGHILVQGQFKPDQEQRITVLIGEKEYVARAVKADEALGMSILKLDSADTFVPLDISAGADLAIGEWAVVLKSTDEEFNFQKMSALAACQGEKPGLYRKFILGQYVGNDTGALVVNLAGKYVGILDRGAVLALNDLRDDVQRMLAEVKGVGSAEDEKKKKGWFGAALVPINKDLAKARNLSPSALQVLYATKGSPAADAGLRPGDLIVGLNGKPLRLTGARALEYFSKAMHPRTGEKFTVTAIRDGKPGEYGATFISMPEPKTMRAEDLGVSVSDITDGAVFALNLGIDKGVLVTDVIKGSAAANSGTLSQTLVSRFDVITELAGQPTPDLAAFSKVLETIRRDHPPVALVKYQRGQVTGYAALNLALGEKNNKSN